MTTPDHNPSPGQYGEHGATAGGQQPGGLLLRWLARIIDGILVAIVSYALIFVSDSVSNYFLTGLFTGALTFVYFVLFEVSIGATPGKKLLSLSVHGPAGAPKPTAAQSAIRNSWTLLPIIPFIGGLLGVVAIIIIAVTINGSPTKQGKHDELAGGTQVVKG